MQGRPNLLNAAIDMTRGYSDSQVEELLGSPVILLSAPRSGSTLVFEQLAKSAPFWSIGGESHAVFRQFPHLRAENSSLDSMALFGRHADPQTSALFRRCFLALLKDYSGRPYLSLPPENRPQKLVWLEKTPRNVLNIEFLNTVFPEAKFIYLYRDPKPTISSLIEAWKIGLQTGRFVTFQQLPGWPLPAWCFVLPRGWRKMIGKTIPEITAFQWQACQNCVMEGLGPMNSDRWTTIDYRSFVDHPSETVEKISTELAIDIQYRSDPGIGLPLSRTTVSEPAAEKWRRHESVLEPLESELAPTVRAVQDFIASKVQS